MDSSDEPHQRVVLNGRRLGVVHAGLLGEGLQGLRHSGADGFEAEIWFSMERVWLLAFVVDDAMLLRLDSALGARLVLVCEDRPIQKLSAHLAPTYKLCCPDLHASAMALVVGNHNETSEACVDKLAEFIHLLYTT